MKKIVLTFALLILASSLSQAFSISPTTSLDYENGLNEEVYINVHSSSNQNLNLITSLRGDLAEYVEIQETITLSAGQTKKVPVQINIPEIEGYMGTNSVRVDFIKQEEEQDAMFGTRVRLVHRIDVEFPYPGEYVDITDFDVTSVNEGRNATYSLELTGRGEITTNYNTLIEVLSGEETVISENTGSGTIDRGETVSSSGTLNTQDFLPGNYRVVKTVNFADNSGERIERFTIGEEDVTIMSINPDILAAESMNYMEITVRSLWTENFNNVHARIEVEDVSVRTPSESLNALRETTLSQYLDARNIEPGEYEANITILFDGFEKTFQETLTFSEDQSVRVENPQNLYRNLTIFLALLLVLALISMLYIIFKRN